MMMNLYRQNRRRSFVPALIVGACAAVFLIDWATGGFLRSRVHAVGSHAWVAAVSVADSFERSGVFRLKHELAKENDELKTRLLILEESASLNRALLDEREQLRELVQFIDHESKITARVSSSFRASPYGTFVIEAGEVDGVAVGHLILTSGGYALGTVTSTDAHRATVQAFFAAGETVDVMHGDFAFTLVGRGGGNARAEISRDAPLVEYDVLVAQPWGYPVARIGRITTASSSATKTIFAHLPVSGATLRYVVVVRN